MPDKTRFFCMLLISLSKIKKIRLLKGRIYTVVPPFFSFIALGYERLIQKTPALQTHAVIAPFVPTGGVEPPTYRL